MKKESRGSLSRGKTPGTWRCEYYIDGVKQPGITVRAKLKNEAAQLVKAIREERAKGPALDVTSMTLRGLVEAWLSAHLPDVKTINTKRNYRYVASHYLGEFGDRQLNGLTSTDLIAFKGDMLDERGLSPATVILTLKVIKSTFRWATSQVPPLIAQNIAAPLTMPAREPSPREHFTLEEGLALLEVSPPPARACLALGMMGLRASEVAALRREDVDNANDDPERRVVYVRRKFVYAEKVEGTPKRQRPVKKEPPKNGGIREVAIPVEFQPIMKEHKEWSMTRHNLTDLMFVSKLSADRPMYLEQPVKWVAAACKAAGIEQGDRGFHSLRHSFVMWNRDQGIPDRDIAHAGGWASTVQIQKLYGNHPNGKRNQQMTAAFSRAVAAVQAEASAEKAGGGAV